MGVLLVWLAIPSALLAVWAFGLATHRQIARRAAIGLAFYGLAAVVAVFAMNWLHMYPEWAGPERYGVIIPLFVGLASIGAAGICGLIGLIVSRTIVSGSRTN